jgi:CIC family chloride channel protein
LTLRACRHCRGKNDEAKKHARAAPGDSSAARWWREKKVFGGGVRRCVFGGGFIGVGHLAWLSVGQFTMPIDPATGEEEEDLSKIEWGAGLARLLEGQLPNMIFFGMGWSLLALPCYLATGWHEEYLSKGSDVVFPIVLSAAFFLFCIGAVIRLRAPLLAARAHQAALRRGGLQAPIMPPASPGGRGPSLTSLPSHTDEIDTSWKGILGFTVYSEGRQRAVENVALICATTGYVGFGWASGLSTFCAYNKGHDLVYWEECYQVNRAFTGVQSDTEQLPTHLPQRYFELLLVSFLATILGPLGWFVMWKVVRQFVRPPRMQERTDDGLRELPQTAMFALAFSVGCIAGLGAWVFRKMIGLVHNILFMQESVMRLGHGSVFAYDANSHTPPPYNLPLELIILAPILGGLIVAFLVQNWAPEAKGHGVPEVMDAIHYKQGKIRPSVAGVKILASSFSIGSGGSVGREGPIIQIGSTFGSMVGVASGCSVSQRVTLIACGAAGGIAATFNTPIGGVVFAMELMLPASNSRTLMPLGITSVVATYIGRAAIGLHPAFDVPALQDESMSLQSVLSLLFFIPFGILVGLVSVLFVKGIYWSEDFFEALPGTYYSRHSLGMLGQGLLIYCMMMFTGSNGEYGHYYVQGVGYATIKDVLSWEAATEGSHAAGSSENGDTGISNPPFCMLLFLTKLLSTNMTIGSGASGGIFSPSLFLGATLGGVWGHIIAVVDPLGNAATFDPVQACVAGMAGMVGGSTGASITAITMTFEMTRDYSTILPIIITTVLAHMTRKAISEDSIYTLKLVRRGHVVPEGLQAAVHAAQRVQDVMTQSFRVVGKQEPMTRYDGVTLVLDEDHSQEFEARGAFCYPSVTALRLAGHDIRTANRLFHFRPATACVAVRCAFPNCCKLLALGPLCPTLLVCWLSARLSLVYLHAGCVVDHM